MSLHFNNMGAPQGPTARQVLKPMGSAAATAERSGWGMGAAIWTSAKNNDTPRVNAGVRRLNAYTTNMKEANRNARRVPT